MAEQCLLYSQAQLRDFLALLRTRDLVVLAGDSGSGKTSLVRAAAKAIGGTCTIIPVKPNWTGPEDLLGYFNPIERSYQATPFLLALRSEEHTSELQSLMRISYAVFCLKKKKEHHHQKL